MFNQFSDRKLIIIGIFILIGIIFILRLFHLQVIDSSYQSSAESNSTRYETQFPGRGLIFDRNGKLLVYNDAAFDLVAIPRHIHAFDTALICKTIDIDIKEFKESLAKAKSYSSYKPSIIVRGISRVKYAQLQEIMYRYPGFSTQKRTIRKYPIPTAAHMLGYVGEVDENQVKKDNYYKSGDYTGLTGIESTYEEALRGKKGLKIYLVDVHNNVQGSYKNGELDVVPEAGSNIVSTIDRDLQLYGEKLFQNKKGSIVAIEPSTGEILAFVSSPCYDPNLLVGMERAGNFNILKKDTLNPLFNRACMASYPPGSTFKLVNGLIGLQEKVITVNSSFACRHGYQAGSFHLGCHHSGSMAFIESIQRSCNAYYCNVFRLILDNKKYNSVRDGYIQWRKYVNSFGLGIKLGTDLSSELRGLVPSPEYFDKVYGGTNTWKSLMLVSMSIGQGELGVTPLQMANLASAIANRGYYYIPHGVKSIAGGFEVDKKYSEKHVVHIDTSFFRPVIEGMQRVVEAGTATSAKIDSIIVCGKTGTAENPHGADHSIFLAFAPKDNPKIAIAVYVENAGFGSTWAAPIASLMIQKYIWGNVPAKYPSDYWEKRILERDLIRDPAPVSKPKN